MYAAIKSTLVANGYGQKDDPLSKDLVAAAVQEAQAQLTGTGATLSERAAERLLIAGACTVLAGVDIGNHKANIARLTADNKPKPTPKPKAKAPAPKEDE